MRQCLDQRHQHRHRDDRQQERTSDAHGSLIKRRQEHRIEHAENEQHRAEERDVCIDARKVRAVGVDVHRQDRKRHREHKLRQLDRHDHPCAGAHLLALRDRQHGAVIGILILAAVEKGEEDAEQTIEKRDRVRIARDEQHRAEEREHIHHRVRCKAQILTENPCRHSFSFPRAREYPRARASRRRAARDSARESRRTCRCAGSPRP